MVPVTLQASPVEEKESINENIPEEELESASGGNTDRRELRRQKQERNREDQEAGFLRRMIDVD